MIINTRPHRVADLLTSIFAPAHVVIVLLLVVGADSGPSLLPGLGWGALAALLVAAMPYAWVLYAVKQRRYPSRHIPDRAQRILPLAVAAAAAAAGLLVLVLLHAPQPLVALVVAMLTGLAVTITVTLAWKISIHVAVTAGAATILTLVFGPALLPSWALVAATGWSRVQLKDHSVAQVAAGAALGAAVAAAVFQSLR